MTTILNEPIVNLPFLYINGMVASNDATTPNSVLDISAGQCRDSANVMDIVCAAANINATVNGLNGLDTGSLAASTMYAIYAIADVTANPSRLPGYILTLASNSLPLMPFGYSNYRLVGYWMTDGSSHFRVGYVSNSIGGNRLFVYDAPVATAVTAGNSNTYAAVDLSTLVPNLQNVPVIIQTNFNANAAADVLNLQGAASTGDTVGIIAQVAGATAHLESYNLVLAQTASSKPEVKYKVSAGAVAINVAGFYYNV